MRRKKTIESKLWDLHKWRKFGDIDPDSRDDAVLAGMIIGLQWSLGCKLNNFGDLVSNPKCGHVIQGGSDD